MPKLREVQQLRFPANSTKTS